MEFGFRRRTGRAGGRLAALLGGLGLAGLAFAPAAGAVVSARPDSTWGTNGRVLAILQAGTRIYVGGTFTSAVAPGGGPVARSSLLALDAATGQLDLGFTPDPGGEVDALASDGTSLFVGGKFAAIGGLKRKNLAAVNLVTGAALPGWKADANARIEALAVGGAGNSRVYAGGSFTALTDAARTTIRYNLAAVRSGDGSVDTAWDAAVAGEDPVRALALSADGSRLFFGGDFTAVHGAARGHLAAVNALSGALDPFFAPWGLPVVFDVIADATRVYVALGGNGGQAQGLDPATGVRRWSVFANGNVQSVALHGGLLYVGGHFSGTNSFGNQTRYKLAAVDPANGAVNTFTVRVDSPLGVFEVHAAGNHVFIGGDFASVDGVSQPHFAQLTG
jgi:hypothetical protein